MNLHLRVKAGGKVNLLTRDARGNWLMKVKAPPVNGKANEEVIRFLSEILKIPKAKITLESGFNHPYKKLRIENVNEEDVLSKLQQSAR